MNKSFRLFLIFGLGFYSCLFLGELWGSSIYQISAEQSPDLAVYQEKAIANLEFLSDGPVTRISEEDLMKLVHLVEGTPFSVSMAEATVEELYSTGLFYDVQIQVEAVQQDRVNVRILLVRRYRVSEINFEGDLELREQRLLRELTFRQGEPYSDSSIEETVSRLIEVYQNEGYYQARIEPRFSRNNEKATVEVTLEVETGERAQVRTLEFDIEGSLEESDISSVMEIRPGSYYSNYQMEEDIDQIETFLSMEGYLRPDVYVRGGAQYDFDTNTVDLVLRIVPREHTEIIFNGIELSQDEKMELPLFSQRGPSQAFLEETASIIRRQLQEDGYFTAEVEVRAPADGSELNKIIFDVTRGERSRVKAVRFEGNRFAEDGSLAQILQIETAGFFGRGRLTRELLDRDRESIQFYYQQRGFLDVQVDAQLTTASQDLTVTFQIEEGPRYYVNSVEIEGNQEVDTAVLRGEMTSREGDPFSALSLAQDRADIVGYYENLGYRDVDFSSEIRYSEKARVDIRYTIREGRRYFVDKTVIIGDTRTKRPVIQREVMLVPGEPLSLDRMLQTETNLYNLAVFNRVQVRATEGTRDPSYRPTFIELEEANKYTLLYGIGYSSGGSAAAGARGTLGITDNNFLGSARTLSLSMRVGTQRQRGNLSYTIPQIRSVRLPTVLSLTVDNEERVDDQSDSLRYGGRPFDSLRYIASSQSELVLSQRESLFFRYNFERVELTVPDDLVAPLQFFRAQEDVRLSRFSTSYLNESRDDPTNPRQGFLVNGEVQVAPGFLGSQEEFLSVLTQGQYFYPIFPDLIVAASLRIGAITPFGGTADRPVDNPVPISERFFAGGGTTLRGLPQDLAGPLLTDENGEIIIIDKNPDEEEEDLTAVPLGGNALLIGNLELRFPIVGLLGGALFYDIGNVFDSITRLGRAGFSNAIGFGLSISTPVGPIRLDLAYNPDPPDVAGFKRWLFHVNLGQPF